MYVFIYVCIYGFLIVSVVESNNPAQLCPLYLISTFLFRIPSLMKDLLRLCFSSSPYELAPDPSRNSSDGPNNEDRSFFSTESGDESSSLFSSSFQAFSGGAMSSGELLHSNSDLIGGTAQKVSTPQAAKAPKGFSSMELFTKRMKKPMQCRVAEVLLRKMKVRTPYVNLNFIIICVGVLNEICGNL